jgi:hypothetical protein
MPSKKKDSQGPPSTAYRFESARLESLFPVLDAVAWMDMPTSAMAAQYAGIDPRTAGKLLKNAVQIGLIEQLGDKQFRPSLPYPYKGSLDQKKAVVKEALVRLPLLASLRQHTALGDSIAIALRKAATIAGITPYQESNFKPLIEWADALGALSAGLVTEDLVDAAAQAKEKRHRTDAKKVVAFLSHSSKDKPFIRQLATDLTADGIDVWLDEQRIRVGDSIPESIAQGLAQSDYFLIAVSQNSIGSDWVRRELNNALIDEVERRQVKVLPLRLDGSSMPDAIKDKKYADFSRSYKTGLEEVLQAMKEPRR